MDRIDKRTTPTKGTEQAAQAGQPSPLDDAVEALGRARAALRAKHGACFAQPKATCDAAHRLDAALGEAERIARLAQGRGLADIEDVPDKEAPTAAVEPTTGVCPPPAGACGGGDSRIWAAMTSDALGNARGSLRTAFPRCFGEDGGGDGCNAVLALDEDLREARAVASGLAHGQSALASCAVLGVDEDTPDGSGGDGQA